MAKVTLLGNVNLLGLNQYGKNPGMSPLLGVGIGAGAETIGELAASKLTSWDPQKVGVGVGLLTSAVLWAMPKTRHAGVAAFVGVGLATALPWLKRKLSGGALGVPQINYLNGLGVHQVEYLNGLGVHTAGPTRTPHGTIPGVAGLAQAGIMAGPDSGQPPVDLLGPSTARSQQVLAMGGPAISGMGAGYGATIFGGSR